MKHCPACNFSFPDFQRVCDFDGTELVPDPERPAINASSRSLRLRHVLKSPVLWAGLLLAGVVSSAFLVAYHDAVNQSTPAVRVQPAPASSAVARTSQQLPAETKTSVTDKRGRGKLTALPGSSVGLRPKVSHPQSIARLHQKSVLGNWSRKSEIASRTDGRAGERRARQSSEEKNPKFVAILKTTWNVLKKPFKF